MRLDVLGPDYRWYWVATHTGVSGLLILEPTIDTIASGAPIFRARYLGRPLTEFMDAYPDCSMRRLKLTAEEETRFHDHRCKMCQRAWYCVESGECRMLICDGCRKKGR